ALFPFLLLLFLFLLLFPLLPCLIVPHAGGCVLDHLAVLNIWFPPRPLFGGARLLLGLFLVFLVSLPVLLPLALISLRFFSRVSLRLGRPSSGRCIDFVGFSPRVFAFGEASVRPPPVRLSDHFPVVFRCRPVSPCLLRRPHPLVPFIPPWVSSSTRALESF